VGSWTTDDELGGAGRFSFRLGALLVVWSDLSIGNSAPYALRGVTAAVTASLPSSIGVVRCFVVKNGLAVRAFIVRVTNTEDALCYKVNRR
jgi:hypothetical protein